MADCCPLCKRTLEEDTPPNFDVDSGAIVIGNRTVFLTPRESELWAILWMKRPRVVSKEHLLEAIYWRADEDPEIKIIDVFVSKIRRKLRGSGLVIQTHWGNGYSACLETEDVPA